MCVCEMKICGCGRASADGQIAPPRDKLYAWNEFKRARKDRVAQGEGETKQRARASGRRARSCTVVAADHQARGIKLQDRKLGGGGVRARARKICFSGHKITSGECFGAQNPFDVYPFDKTESFCFVLPSFYLGRHAGAC